MGVGVTGLKTEEEVSLATASAVSRDSTRGKKKKNTCTQRLRTGYARDRKRERERERESLTSHTYRAKQRGETFTVLPTVFHGHFRKNDVVSLCGVPKKHLRRCDNYPLLTSTCVDRRTTNSSTRTDII